VSRHFKSVAALVPARLLSVAGPVALVAAALLLASPAQAASPAWKLSFNSYPTHLAPGDSTSYEVFATNVGGAATSGSFTFSETFPTGLTPILVFEDGHSSDTCGISGQTATCTDPEALYPGQVVVFRVRVNADPFLPDPSAMLNQVTVTGGAAAPAQASTTTQITSAAPVFDFLAGPSGLGASLTNADGLPVTAAGSHPDQLTVDLGLSNFKPATGLLAPEGGPRDVRTYLPHGLIVDPSATPVRCTEVQFELNDCPDESAVGVMSVLTTVGAGSADMDAQPLWNLVPPPGTAASFGFNAVGVNIYVHLLGGLRAGDYALAAYANDILALGTNPIFGARVQLWGDPSSPSHDHTRGECGNGNNTKTCPVPQQTTPLLSMPSSCGEPMAIEAEADSWEHPGVFHERSAPITDLEGNPSAVDGCDNPELRFAPTLQARPTTNVADSPTGLDVDLHIPQTDDLSELATPHLRKAVVTLPEGLVINPSSANGLAGCSSAQVGIDPTTGIADGNHATCPDASRIGSVEVETPLLDHPLPGSVYIATPHDNPFDSLLAIYIVVDDPQSGVVVKLAGHVVADPKTGRLTTVFDNNPQLPFEDFKLNFFGGPAAPLRTPATCSKYSTTSQMTPWSAPASGPPATPSDTYAINKAPAGGSCASALPNTPSFDAGSVSLIAGSYTPFVFNLKRNDGTQQFSKVSLTPPPGLLGKLAGTPYCPEAALSAAASKSGNQEKANPSCPQASQVGVADVGAGAGPAPYYTQGKAYLAGPYKGAPLSMAIVTPATAGPYDLGTVVVRTALNIDPETTRITAVSDPIPQILQGIPLDVRSIQLKLDKPDFTLNPTSCNPFAVTGQLVSTLGQAAALQNPFQVAECARLGFRPRLALRLKGATKRGGHPALRATVTYPKGFYANIAKASVALPHSEFLDQAHIGTVCTRVQFAANACPAASVYGKATATTPLLDQPLSGPVYLRSSSNALPDLVADLSGQIHVVLDGRIDSVNGGIRSTFEAVPDAPVSKFVLEMKGGRKGLLVNSRNLCKSLNKATVLFDGQNGKTADSNPELKNDCKKARKHKRHRGHRRAAR
jgi:hypothetical protein